ncbi:MAG: aldo/keto reductase [Propionibacteriaceae bacterium]|jgi:predicted oxidoreductase|nr:aldo/keto reductase [Propionibacteriaceae bacterium]
MKTFNLPGTDLNVSNVISGQMRIADKTDGQIRELVAVARDAGINLFDHANVYGSVDHECEQRFGDALKWTPAQRSEVILQTKAGIVKTGEDWAYFDFSKAEIISAVEGSLKALNTDYIDILLLHRPDALVEPEEVAAAFDELETLGKVRYFGVSNQSPRQIELLKKTVRQPLVVNQVQLSITHAPLVAQGLSINMENFEQSVVLDGGGLLDYCRLNDITIQAWSPFQRGFFDGTFLGDYEREPKLNKVIDRLAGEYNVEPIGIATAWILRHPANMQVVLGTTTPARVAAASAASDITLTKRDWYELAHAAGYVCP